MKKFIATFIAFVFCITGMIVTSLSFLAPVTQYRIRIFSKSVRIVRVHPLLGLKRLETQGILSLFSIEGALMMKILIAVALWAILLVLLLYFIYIISRIGLNKKTDIHGSSRWSDEKELEEAGLLGGQGVVLGQTFDAVYKRKSNRGDLTSPKKYKLKKEGKIIAQEQTQHTLIVGATRSGKGINCIIPTMFAWPGSLILLDPKAEAWSITAGYRAKFSHVFKFHPEKPEESIHYNPLLAIRRGRNCIPDIQNLAYILMPQGEEKDPFWSDEGRKLFTAVVGYVLYCENEKTFKTVYSIFSNDEAITSAGGESGGSVVKTYLKNYSQKIDAIITRNEMSPAFVEKYKARESRSEREKRAIEAEYNEKLNDDDVKTLTRIKADLQYFAACEDKQLNSTVSTMLSKLSVIADPSVQEVTSTSDFRMEDFQFLNKPISLYICASSEGLPRLSPLFKIFYEQAISNLTRELKTPKHKLQLIFDEFRQMGKMDVVEKGLALTAGYGVLYTIVIQSYAQLKKIYGSETLFTDNCAYQVILRVNDPDTGKKIEQILGHETRMLQSVSFSGNVEQSMHKGENISMHQMGRALMTAQEILTMPFDEVLILASGEQPYRGKKIMYFMDRRFTSRYLDSRGRVIKPPVIDEKQLPHPEAGKGGIDPEHWNALCEKNKTKKISESERKPKFKVPDTIIEPKGDLEIKAAKQKTEPEIFIEPVTEDEKETMNLGIRDLKIEAKMIPVASVSRNTDPSFEREMRKILKFLIIDTIEGEQNAV